MSRTQRSSGGSSPIKKYLNFGGGAGQVQWFDKNAPSEEQKKGIDSLEFVILDTKSSISGYNEASGKQISSNLLDPFSTGKEPFEIRLGGSVIKKGIWKEIKGEMDTTCKGAKFTTNVFALADVGDGVQVVKLELNGAALKPWIDFTKELGDSVYDKVITITKGQLCTRKEGATVEVSEAEYKKIVAAVQKNPMAARPVLFYVPEFSSEDLTEEQVDEAVKADEELQKYFDSIGVKGASEEATEDLSSNTSPEPAVNAGDEEDSLPF